MRVRRCIIRYTLEVRVNEDKQSIEAGREGECGWVLDLTVSEFRRENAGWWA